MNKLEYIDRIIAEKVELDDRTIKVVEFICRSPVFKSLPTSEQSLLREQRDTMVHYSRLLESRIAEATAREYPE